MLQLTTTEINNKLISKWIIDRKQNANKLRIEIESHNI